MLDVGPACGPPSRASRQGSALSVTNIKQQVSIGAAVVAIATASTQPGISWSPYQAMHMPHSAAVSRSASSIA